MREGTDAEKRPGAIFRDGGIVPMSTDTLISEIDAEIARLQQAHALLAGLAKAAIYPRINNSTLGSKKGMEEVLDLLGMMSHLVELAEEGIAKVLRLVKESIVRDVLAGVVPDAFGGI